MGEIDADCIRSSRWIALSAQDFVACGGEPDRDALAEKSGRADD